MKFSVINSMGSWIVWKYIFRPVRSQYQGQGSRGMLLGEQVEIGGAGYWTVSTPEYLLNKCEKLKTYK